MKRCESAVRCYLFRYERHLSNSFCFSFCKLYSLETIEKLPGAKMYNSFAYDTALLRDFVTDGERGGGARRSLSGSHRPAAYRLSGGSFRGSLRGSLSKSVFRKKQRSGSFTGGSGSGRASFFTKGFGDNGSKESNSRGKGGKGPPADVVLRRSGSR
jgi:hypothetical protein